MKDDTSLTLSDTLTRMGVISCKPNDQCSDYGGLDGRCAISQPSISQYSTLCNLSPRDVQAILGLLTPDQLELEADFDPDSYILLPPDFDPEVESGHAEDTCECKCFSDWASPTICGHYGRQCCVRKTACKKPEWWWYPQGCCKDLPGGCQ
jgi:hypothetical protein